MPRKNIKKQKSDRNEVHGYGLLMDTRDHQETKSMATPSPALKYLAVPVIDCQKR